MAVAMVASFALDVVARLVLARRHLEAGRLIPWPARSVIAAAAAYAAGFAAARMVDSALSGLPGLAAACVAGTIAFVAAFIACGGVLPADRHRLAAYRRTRAAGRDPVSSHGGELVTSAS